ncbi:carboxylesterase family protein [Sphingopyxis sp. J-6]|uniref:carboxylesterase/lipase family protein n=1 Tax=Sphingopyxis sp. J-6 TaxID=3122054 RepID=UPI003983E1B6
MNEIIATTQTGKVKGVSSEGVERFLAIPYGADTGGANRFLPPKPAPKWNGVRDATRPGNRCPQPPLPSNPLFRFSDLPISEDCLIVNVWSPADRKRDERLPVMVWLHGGGYGFGSSYDGGYDGSHLAKGERVVVVSLNHRLNGFGYLDLGPEAGAAYAASGLNGQLDIIAALRWVRANIGEFGGDAGNVTLFGQSGGGGKISALLAMPAGKGLFQKAIIQSGSDPLMRTSEQGLAVRAQLLAGAGLPPADILKLREMPLDALTALFAKAGILSFGPVVDGRELPTHPSDPVASPVSADVALMVGHTRDEATAILAADPAWPATDDAKLGMMAAMLMGPQFSTEGLALYRSRLPAEKPMYILSDIMADKMFTHNAQLLATRKAAQAAPVYFYRIDWRSPVMNGVLRTPHGVEIPFVFGTVDTAGEMTGQGASQDRMTALMQHSWGAFARSGNPSTAALPAWPRYDAKTRATMIFADKPAMMTDPAAELRRFWDKVSGLSTESD